MPRNHRDGKCFSPEGGVSEAAFMSSLEVIYYVVRKVLVSLGELRPTEFAEDLWKYHGGVSQSWAVISAES